MINSNPFPVIKEIAYWTIAILRSASSPFKYQNRAPATSAPFSVSIHPCASPISQCVFTGKSNFVSSQKNISATPSSSVNPTVAVGSRKFGSR